MNRYVLLVLIIIVFGSCNWDGNSDSYIKHSFIFYPRKCNVVFAENFSYWLSEEGTQYEWYEYENLESNAVKANEYLMRIITSNLDTVFSSGIYYYLEDSLIDEHDTEIEKVIADNFDQVFQQSSGEWTLPPVKMDYRLDEVKDLSITSVVPLFNKPANSVLNQHFEITSFSPDFIVSSSKQLRMGFNEQLLNRINLAEYLSYQPLAAPCMYLVLKSVPPEVPVETRFIIEIETNDGKIISDTTEVINLLP
jgi:hypothetical protein